MGLNPDPSDGIEPCPGGTDVSGLLQRGDGRDLASGLRGHLGEAEGLPQTHNQQLVANLVPEITSEFAVVGTFVVGAEPVLDDIQVGHQLTKDVFIPLDFPGVEQGREE